MLLKSIIGVTVALEVFDLLIRIITACVGLPVLLVVFIALPPLATGILFALMSALAAYELLWNTGLVKHPRLVGYSMLMALSVGLGACLDTTGNWMVFSGLVFCLLMVMELLISKAKMPLSVISYCTIAAIAVPWLLCSVVRIRYAQMGNIFVLMPFAITFTADTGAYFVGRFLGKHKLAPTISPKKTVEGVVGGVAAAILGVLVFGLVLLLGFDAHVNFFYAIIYGIIGSLICVVGDLAFSVVKRQTGIKDYGKLLPGHGGILDRFDSLCLVGPAVEAMLICLPIAEFTYG